MAGRAALNAGQKVPGRPREDIAAAIMRVNENEERNRDNHLCASVLSYNLIKEIEVGFQAAD